MNIVPGRIPYYLVGWLLIFSTILFPQGMRSEQLIYTNPRDLLLSESDLADLGTYTIPIHQRYPLTNEAIVYLLGDEIGTERVARTARIVGWWAYYARSASGNSGPADITLAVTQYGSNKGAFYNLNTYTFSRLLPAEWTRLDTCLHLGDSSAAEIRHTSYANGETRVSLALHFIYHNVGVRLVANGSQDQVRLADLSALAHTILARLEKAELHVQPVPTPTPGIEFSNSGEAIYR